MLEQGERRLVGPVQVVQHQHDGGHARLLGEQRGHGLEQQEALGVRLSRRRLLKVGQAMRQLRQQPRQLCSRGDPLLEPRRRAGCDPLTKRFDERLVGNERILVGAPVEDGSALFMCEPAELRCEARLADAGLPLQQDELKLAAASVLPALAQVLQVRFATDQRRALRHPQDRRQRERSVLRAGDGISLRPGRALLGAAASTASASSPADR